MLDRNNQRVNGCLDMTLAQQEWAKSQLGKMMKPPRQEAGIAVDFEPGARGVGVWFYLEHEGEIYAQAYRCYPHKLLSVDNAWTRKRK